MGIGTAAGTPSPSNSLAARRGSSRRGNCGCAPKKSHRTPTRQRTQRQPLGIRSRTPTGDNSKNTAKIRNLVNKPKAPQP